MAKSVTEMANEILRGALTTPSKNPYDAKGNVHEHPAVPSDQVLLEVSDSLRESLMAHSLGKVQSEKTSVKEKTLPHARIDERKKETKGIFISESDLGVLRKAKDIISRIEEATTTGNLGTAQAPTMKKKGKKLKARKAGANSFLDYIAK
tara:strand:+ start:12917 stop:13366 length:450 start_codon:yes stop_codon:yes gene_type:complete